MNERILELLADAGFDPASIERMGILPQAQKFAELIVKDCLKIVEPVEDSGDEWCVTLKETAEEIKEHFGIEG